MASVGEFLAMGGYAGFVWPAYGVAALVLIALVVTSVRAVRAREAELRAVEEALPPRRRPRSGESGR